MGKSLIIIGKGYSVWKCTKEIVDSHDEVCLINSPIYNGYEHLISNRADFMFTNKTGLIYTPQMVKKLGLKKMFFTGHSYQKFGANHSGVQAVYPNPNLYEDILAKEEFKASSGIQALTYFIKTGEYSKITLVGFDFYEIGQPPYYYGVDQAHPEMKYLWGNKYKGNKINATSGHDPSKSIDYLVKLMDQNKDIKFNLISNNTRIKGLKIDNCTNMKKVVILGGGGFIGGHLGKKLKDEGHHVTIYDIKQHEYFLSEDICDKFVVGDLRDPNVVANAISEGVDDVYQLAADMGGAGYIFTGENDANVMHNSALINLNVAHECVKKGVKKIFYSSSACMYPEHNQLDPDNPNCTEESAYPANPDSEYGWEKLFSERLYLAFNRNYGLDVRIARFHNIFGPQGTWRGGKEKAPAALCRKVSEVNDSGEIEIWGDGKQTRSFLYVDECVEAVQKLMESDFLGPVNIGSEEMITINDLANMIIDLSGKDITIKNIEGPTGVRGRNSDNKLYREKVGWEVNQPLIVGIEKTYKWIDEQNK
jgi:nucleoside-diphosphate-sugar epimerase